MNEMKSDTNSDNEESQTTIPMAETIKSSVSGTQEVADEESVEATAKNEDSDLDETESAQIENSKVRNFQIPAHHKVFEGAWLEI